VIYIRRAKKINIRKLIVVCAIALTIQLGLVYGMSGQQHDGFEIKKETVGETVNETIETTIKIVEPVATVESIEWIVYEEVEETIEEPQSIYYDIPLSEELQDHTRWLCGEYNFYPEIVFAMMFYESTFRPHVISKGNYGIMQINRVNHQWLREEFEITDFLDAGQNILCGVVMISRLYEKYDGDIHRALMSYNCGETGGRRLWNQGHRSTRYSRKIVEYAENLLLDEREE
jgi:hypothetical protein